MEAKCYKCANLKMEEGQVPPNWVSDRSYRCVKGRYDRDCLGWFAWSGIVKPNKTVRLAQTGCSVFQEQK